MTTRRKYYEWNAALKTCPICRSHPIDPTTRPDARGEHWCRQCLDDFDSIDWSVPR